MKTSALPPPTPSPKTSAWFDVIDGLLRGLLFAVAILTVLGPSRLEPADLNRPKVAYVADAGGHDIHQANQIRQADFGMEQPSNEARQIADWVIRAQDNKHTDFVIIDKKAARLYVFDANAHLRAATQVLLGAAQGDDTVPGIGKRPIADVKPEERTTPAGRFLAERGHDARGEDVVWIDYDAAVSMHRVLRTNPAEHRLARLASPDIADKRISYGCVNVPVAFFETQISPIFVKHRAMVYVLPEVKPLQQVFTMAGGHLPS